MQEAMVLVPRKPTKAMIEAALALPGPCGAALVETIYTVMLNAAPTFSAPVGDDCSECDGNGYLTFYAGEGEGYPSICGYEDCPKCKGTGKLLSQL